ncbi:conserved hypothetical protein [Caldicellulosiruptor hydrothermalis 108]|uniref:Uncharacterized protein n=1 Tax=Caldicellulosiruptor hydrothermalis (strain DSM 18901 / VKM B-2411 / 108) TaxID=632292 RepID=E4QAC4_CALH1|nr:hypothetical protein [Caldicellulosiruptor hydrothermalis]ADQ08228.1 conserved hypothetical protein [Caldicellulosiruptor hydrothermalis 108]
MKYFAKFRLREKIRVKKSFIRLIFTLVIMIISFIASFIAKADSSDPVSFIYDPVVYVGDELYRIKKDDLYNLSIRGLFDLLSQKNYISDLMTPSVLNKSDESSNDLYNLIAEKLSVKVFPFLNILEPSGNFLIQSELNTRNLSMGLSITEKADNTAIAKLGNLLSKALAAGSPLLEQVVSTIKLPYGIVPEGL